MSEHRPSHMLSARAVGYQLWLRQSDAIARSLGMPVHQARVAIPISDIVQVMEDRDEQWIAKLTEARAGADKSTAFGQLLWRLEIPPIKLRDDAFPSVKAAQAIRKHFYGALLKMARETELKTISGILSGLGIKTKVCTLDDAVSAIFLYVHQARADAVKRTCPEELSGTQDE